MGEKLRILFSLVFVSVLLFSCSSSKDSGGDLEEILKSRPPGKEYLFDYATILDEAEEYTQGYLGRIRDTYRIEAIIVSLPSLGKTRTIENTAVEILSNWGIGKDLAGRGLLLLFADKEKQVKVEVSYELEDVFTDAFCGYIADLQLKPYFLGGQVGTGLLAVMEEIEARAHIKHQATYTPSDIHALDEKLLSGGAGVRRGLSRAQKEEVRNVGWKYPPGKTPEEAWQTMIQSWHDKARDPNLGVYTEIAKLIYRDYQSLPDSRYEKDYRTYRHKPFEVIRNDRYAVIFFGRKEGWDNSPFLFCKTPEGWRFDLVHQRKYIRFGPNPYWGIERTNHPYVELLSPCPYYEGQDIPLLPGDNYRIEEDRETADRISQLEGVYANHPDDFETAINLGRLYTITSMAPKHFVRLKKAKQLRPNDPNPYKYLAIAHIDANYQYESAAREMKAYLAREPDDVFGHNCLGYLFFRLENYQEAIEEFEKAIDLEPDNVYGYCKLSRCYGMLFLQSPDEDRQKEKYRTLAIEMLHQAETTPSVDARRIRWLRNWLGKNRIREAS